MSKQLDYERLLDDWADELFNKVQLYEEKRDKEEMGSYKYGYYQGKHDGVMEALTKLSMFEKRKGKKYEIDQLN